MVIMKQFNSGGLPRNTSFTSIFIKSAVSFLLLGFAYRLFSSSTFPSSSSNFLHQLSPLFLPNHDLNNKLHRPPVNVSQSLSPPPPIPDKDLRTSSHNNGSAKCDLFMGEWIHDSEGPRYTNSSCHVIDGQQNCMKNGRPDSDYMYWRWKPKGCDLPKFHPTKFLNMMRGKSIVFIGDSIMRNHVQSLLCLLSRVERGVDVYHDEQYKNRRWTFPSYSFNVSLLWSPFLTKSITFNDGSLIQLHLDEPDPVWTEQYNDHDCIVIAGGKWFLRSALYYENETLIGCHNCRNPNVTQLGFKYAYRKALNTTLKFVVESSKEEEAPRRRPTEVVLRSLAPDHFENGEWDTGGYCNRTRPYRAGEIEVDYSDGMMRRAEMEEFDKAAAALGDNYYNYRRDRLNLRTRLRMLDATYMSLLRPDGHPGMYRREAQPNGEEDSKGKLLRINDCLHWCLPGPIDSWNDLLMTMLITT